MKKLPFWLLVAGAAGLGVFAILKPPESGRPAVDCNCRQLAADPEQFVGLRVRVSLIGCERTNSEVHWRPLASTPPAVVIRFNGPPPSPLPPFAVGDCRATGRVVVVIGCEPAY